MKAFDSLLTFCKRRAVTVARKILPEQLVKRVLSPDAIIVHILSPSTFFLSLPLKSLLSREKKKKKKRTFQHSDSHSCLRSSAPHMSLLILLPTYLLVISPFRAHHFRVQLNSMWVTQTQLETKTVPRNDPPSLSILFDFVS